VILNTFEDDGESVYAAVKKITDVEFSLAAVGGIRWEAEMSPWKCPPVYKGGAPCTGEADVYLDTLTKEILPEILGQLSIKPSYTALAGYSLAGLFAVYALYRTDVFSRAASASGSFWFPNFLEFVLNNKMKVKPDCVYFSLGDKEAKARSSTLCTVEDNTRMLNKMCNELGIRSTFELNPGNHFKDAPLRMAKGIAWMIGN
jgi:hypothetical protein